MMHLYEEEMHRDIREREELLSERRGKKRYLKNFHIVLIEVLLLREDRNEDCD